ncbi:MAG: hypothetical protein WCI55_04270 [Armatimonadota bacterium]
MDIKDIAPVIALFATLLIPITVILTRHQQKMTLLMHRDSLQQPQGNSEILAVHYEVQQLKSMVSSLSMSVETLRDEIRSNQSVQDRVKIQE